MNKLIQLNTQKSSILHRAQVALDSKGAKSPEYKALIAEAETLQEDIDMLNQIERNLPSSAPAHIAAPVLTGDEAAQRRFKVNAAFRSLLRDGYHSRSVEQRDVLTTNEDGIALVPQEYDSAYIQALKWYGPIATLANQRYSDVGRPQKFITSDDTAATMSYLPESNSVSGLEADPSVASSIKGTDSLVTLVKYSFDILDDAFDLGTFIRDIAGVRVSRSVEYALTLGKDNGTNTALPNSLTGGLLGNVTAGVNQAALADGISYPQLADLQASVDHAYAVNGAYMASPSVFGYLLQQVDGQGRPFYKFDPATGLLQIAGKPLYVNNAMPAFDALSSPVVLFGDFSRQLGYLNGGGVRIRVLTERWADQLEGGAVIYHRLGSTALLSNAVKAFVTAAS